MHGRAPRGFITSLLILTALAGCASWSRCGETIGTAGDVLLSGTGHDVADGAAAGFWLAVQLGCATREAVTAAPPAPPSRLPQETLGVTPVPPKPPWRPATIWRQPGPAPAPPPPSIWRAPGSPPKPAAVEKND